jgi:hypothetical protein
MVCAIGEDLSIPRLKLFPQYGHIDFAYANGVDGVNFITHLGIQLNATNGE